MVKDVETNDIKNVPEAVPSNESTGEASTGTSPKRAKAPATRKPRKPSTRSTPKTDENSASIAQDLPMFMESPISQTAAAPSSAPATTKLAAEAFPPAEKQLAPGSLKAHTPVNPLTRNPRVRPPERQPLPKPIKHGGENGGSNSRRPPSLGGRSHLQRTHQRASSNPRAQNQQKKAHGQAKQQMDKYLNLGKEARANRDFVEAERYFQFADHYYRVLNPSLAEEKQETNT